MKILLLGKNGQVGWELQRALSPIGELISIDRFDTDFCGDLTNLDGIAKTIRCVNPDVVVNAAAYTAVDKAESEICLAARLNTEIVEVLAKETGKIDALLVHYSTDYVFDGSGSHYRKEDEEPRPLNVYGQTKLAGEIAIAKHNPRHFIFRTSWVYAARGTNFIKTMLRLAKEKEILSIINDQHGAPTGAEFIADCTAISILKEFDNRENHGVYHLVASGETTWCDYAKYVFSVVEKEGESLLLKKINSVPTVFYHTAAKRPHNSRMSNKKFKHAFQVNIPDWKDGVKRAVAEIIGK